MIKDMVLLLDRADLTPIDVKKAKEIWFDFRKQNGYSTKRPLLTTENMKFDKSLKAGTITYGLSLAHHKTSGFNVCRYATPACSAACVADAGNGRYPKLVDAREMKTRFLASHPAAFLTILCDELDTLNLKGATSEIGVRLNTFSDLPWERWLDCTRWPNLHIYDYTAWPVDRRPTPKSYDITRSIKETHSVSDMKKMLAAGSRIAVCVDIKRKDVVPSSILGVPAIDGDKTDARFIEPSPAVVVLRPKGSARKYKFTKSLESLNAG